MWPFTKKRTMEQVKADFEVLCNEIDTELNKMGDGGSGPMMRIALFMKRKDLERRWNKLLKEAKDLE